MKSQTISAIVDENYNVTQTVLRNGKFRKIKKTLTDEEIELFAMDKKIKLQEQIDKYNFIKAEAEKQAAQLKK